MPTRFDETDWLLTLEAYLKLKQSAEPITASNLLVRKLASALQERRITEFRERTAGDAKNQVRAFAYLDPDTPYQYEHPKNVPEIAKQVWRQFAVGADSLSAIQKEIARRGLPAPSESRGYWWVNQKKTYRHEIGGGYMWSPKENEGGSFNPYYEFMRCVIPGDIIFSFRDGKISNIGVAASYAISAPKPLEFVNTKNEWADGGWRIEVVWNAVPRPIRTTAIIEEIRDLLPEKYAPVRAESGHGKEFYLTRLPLALADLLLQKTGTISEDLAPLSHEIPDGESALEEIVERQIWRNKKLTTTQKRVLTDARIGQDVFRSNIEQIEKGCRITGIMDKRLLRASHIKPWARCAANEERLDGENGFLLTPAADHLFDRFLITFSDNGDVMLSPSLNLNDLATLGILSGMKVKFGGFTNGQKKYLAYHRARFAEASCPQARAALRKARFVDEETVLKQMER